MLKSISVFLTLAIILAVSCGCGSRGNSGNGSNRSAGSIIDGSSKTAGGQIQRQEDTISRQHANVPQREEAGREEADIIKEQVEKMTLDEKIGQMVIVGVDGYTSDGHSREMIEYCVGGFILFKRNIRDASETLGLINSLKEMNQKNKIPLFIGIDEEGGRVTRMPGEFTRLPTAKKIGQVNSSGFSYQIGRVIAEELKAFGMNVNFAPVLDINSNPENPVIGDRAFGTEPETVSSMGIQVMKGLQSNGVISVIKHFPGHGDTSEDSHNVLPVVRHDLDRLKNFELIPFSRAIENDADAVMVAHILLPEIDKENPASLSKTIITDILRTDLMFNGVVITDDMTMGAIVEKYDIGDAAVKSINAGSDIVLVCHGYDRGIAVIKALKEAVEAGVINEDRINSSVYRILKLKQKYNLSDEKIKSIDVNNINSLINQVLSKKY